ncbi:alpha/beta-hydrolase [Delitschia confertaspora ATCC 74209]|uniref:Alpha/beta-hydrolase n=1 Tax=Delitschia confertaspora ATCC 74209 TaxID=1513339 RepID=A0A9P4JCB7_9PLEO|nr:alpha/beta-hydrolase [Delitschia confertaspora ATCC 74209]
MSFGSSLTVLLALVSGIWIPALILCSNRWFQRQMLYLHKVTFRPGKSLKEPERLGFLQNQVAPFRIPTEDGEELFAWLITPLDVYGKYEEAFETENIGPDRDVENRLAFKCLKEDPESRLLIYFHGNAATIAQTRRTEEYRLYSSGADKIYTLAFDYRGFGLSTGSPSEKGLLNDGIAVLDWALNVANIPPDRIVLLGHSLGTAVSTAVTHHFLNLENPIEFSGLVLCASFTNGTNAFLSYAIVGLFPLLAPLKVFPYLEAWFGRRMVDTWKTDERLAEVVRKSSRLHLAFIHAVDDLTMPWQQTEQLFHRAICAALPKEEIVKNLVSVDLGEAGQRETWRSAKKQLSKLIMRHGGHDTMQKWSPAALKVLQCFGLDQKREG